MDRREGIRYGFRREKGDNEICTMSTGLPRELDGEGGPSDSGPEDSVMSNGSCATQCTHQQETDKRLQSPGRRAALINDVSTGVQHKSLGCTQFYAARIHLHSGWVDTTTITIGTRL